MPTGSYDSSVVSTFILATQPLGLYDNGVSVVPFTYQPITFWSNNYLASYSDSIPINEVLSSVVIGIADYPIAVIDSNNTSSPNVFIIR
jgi:hypothetical protein